MKKAATEEKPANESITIPESDRAMLGAMSAKHAVLEAQAALTRERIMSHALRLQIELGLDKTWEFSFSELEFKKKA